MRVAVLNIIFIITLGLLIIASMSIGTSDLDHTHVFAFFKSIFSVNTLDESQTYILKSLRFPRTMTALWVGANLGLAGLLLQTLLDNPLAEPYTLGLSGGATLGALVGLVIPLTPFSFWLPVGALLGCAFVTVLVLLLIKKSSGFQSRSLILFGIMISLFCGSLVTLLLSLFSPDKLHTAIHWMMGHCGTIRDLWWPSVAAAGTIGALWTLANAKSLDTLLLGEDLASSIGIPLPALRIQIVLIVSILTATSVSLMGLVGFVGLLAPHLANLLTKSRRTNATLILTLTGGAILLLGSDVLGRIIGGDTEIPAGSLVALLGAPFLMGLLLKRFRDV